MFFMTVEKVWEKRDIDIAKIEAIAKENNISQTLATLLFNRGITDPKDVKDFLFPDFFKLEKILHNPYKLKDVELAADRIKKAILNKEKVMFAGDYDADGITSTALFYLSMKELGLEVDIDIPNRFKDGYGINKSKVPKFKKYDLVVTGDVGIKEFNNAIEIIKDGKTDLIITDHHDPLIVGPKEKNLIPENAQIIEQDGKIMGIPKALAVVNPKRIDCKYKSKDLSGVAVIFKLLEVVFEKMNIPKQSLYSKLDIVALGLVADVVPQISIDGETKKKKTFEVRNLIKLGLLIMNQKPKKWTNMIKNIRYINEEINSEHLGFLFGPLLNAPGRISDPYVAFQLFVHEDEEKLKDIIDKLNAANEERKETSRKISKEVIEKIEQSNDSRYEHSIVFFSEKCHTGITGLVASSVVKHFNKPTIIFGPEKDSEGNTVLKGSARSVDGIHLLNALVETEKYIGQYVYGGHEGAAGLTLKEGQLNDFFKYFSKAVEKQLKEAASKGLDLLNPVKKYDMEIEIKDVNNTFVHELSLMEPFGMGNKRPLFKISKCFIKEFDTIMNGNGARFIFNDAGVHYIKGITFSNGKEITEKYLKRLEKNPEKPVECEVLGCPVFNYYKGHKNIQFMVEEIKIK